MTATRLNPDSLYESTCYGFSHAALDERNGVLHLAGQVAWDRDYQIVGGDDLAAQTRQVLANIRTVLEAAGCDLNDLLRLRTYIVDHDMEKLRIVSTELAAFYADVVPAPNTIVGVQSLALPGFLVEIEAIATVT